MTASMRTVNQEETEEKTWEGYDKANEEYNGAIYTYIPVIPESEEIPEDTALPEIHVQVGDAGIALYSGGIEGQGTEENPWQIKMKKIGKPLQQILDIVILVI